MPTVRFTNHLRRFFPELADDAFEGLTVAELVVSLDQRHPGLAAYLVDDRGALRKHVNVFVDGEMVRDRLQLSDPVAPGSEVHVVQALSGG